MLSADAGGIRGKYYIALRNPAEGESLEGNFLRISRRPREGNDPVLGFDRLGFPVFLSAHILRLSKVRDWIPASVRCLGCAGLETGLLTAAHNGKGDDSCRRDACDSNQDNLKGSGLSLLRPGLFQEGLRSGIGLNGLQVGSGEDGSGSPFPRLPIPPASDMMYPAGRA